MPSLLEPYEVPDAIKALDPTIPLISPSQFAIYNRCAYSWHFRYVKGYNPIPTNDASEVGLLIHRLLQVGYDSKKTHPQASYEVHATAVQKALLGFKSQFKTYEQMSQLTKAGELVKKYFQTVASLHDKGHMVVGVEKHFVVMLFTPLGNPYYLQGYIDLLMAMRGGGFRIEDHKSTGDKRRFYTQDQAQMDSQLKSYAIALRELGFKVNDAAIRNYNTYEYKDPEAQAITQYFDRVPVHYTDKELETFEKELGHLVDEMFYDSRNPFRRTLSKDCASCWIKEACLMDQRGMDLTLLLKNKYTRKPMTETVKELIIGVDKGIKVV